MMTKKITITEQLHIHAESTPDKVAYTFLRDDGKIDEITFKDLFDQVRGLAASILIYAEYGTRALLLYPSGLEFIKAYLACMYAGIIAVPATLPRKTRSSQRLMAILKDADPALILTTSDCIQAVKASYSPADLKNCSCLATDGLDRTAVTKKLPQISIDSAAFLQYTSGSTGNPKGVEVTHKNIISNVQTIQKAFGFSKESIMVGWLPLFHDMGLIGNVISPLYVGFQSVLMSPNAFLKNPFLWLKGVSDYRGTCAGAPNFGWDYCVSRISEEQKKELDLSCLEVAYNGSEPVRADTLRRFYEAFAACGIRQEALFPCYGMAEATLFVSGGPPRRTPVVLNVSKTSLEGNQIRAVSADSNDARQIVSSGHVGEETSVVVVDPETCLPCSRRRVGEIWIAGDNVGKGYWNRPEETQRTFQAYLTDSGVGPFLRTGDLGFVQEGELFITGRLKDLIIINGRNIYPQDIEQVIEQSIDFIAPNMSAAFSVDIDGQERLAIVAEANRNLMRAAQVENEDAGSETEQVHAKNEYLMKIEMLARDVCEIIAEQFDVSVASIVFVKPGTFPRTSSGKVQRLKCKQMALNGQLDLVYVMPGSIFDRRDPPGPYLSSVAQSVEPANVNPTKSLIAGTAPRHKVEVRTKTDAHQSKAKADAMIEWFRNYAERRLNSRLIDERRTVPPYVVLDLGNQGFFGLQVPRRFGGCELATADLLRVMEQVAGVDLTLALLIGVHNGLGVRPILGFAAESIQQQLLPSLAAGRQLAAFALTEPGAGSNPLAMGATAIKKEGGWLVNAEKQWIGIGSWAGMLTIFAKAPNPVGQSLGTIALMIPEDTPGLSQGPEALTMGMRGIVQNTVYLKDAFVPDSALLGKVGEGMAIAQDAMMFSRLGIGAMSLGAMKRCAQLMARYAANRTISTGLLADNPVTLTRLEDITSAIFAIESLIYEIAALIDHGKEVPVEAYIACKTSGPELLGEAADHLVQLLGGRGYVETNMAPQILRDARVLRIFEGPTETLNMHLGANVLRQNQSVVNFISKALGSSHVANELLDAVTQMRSAATRIATVFSAEASSDQWIQFQVGQVATAAIVLAAAEKGAKEGQEASGRAVDWARRRFTELRHNAMARFDDNRHLLSSKKLLWLINQYKASIGDVEQQLAGEGHALDNLMRREKRVVEQPPSELQERALPDSSRAVANFLSQYKVGKGQETAGSICDDINVIKEEGVESHDFRNAKSEATREMVHDCVLKWLRTEKRRKLDKVDYDVSFTSLGMDSLGAVALTVELERRIGVNISPEIVYEYQTINKLAPYIDVKILP